jgi:hypothetical protein
MGVSGDCIIFKIDIRFCLFINLKMDIYNVFKYKELNMANTEYHYKIIDQLQETLEGDSNTIILDTETDGKNKIVQISYYILNESNDKTHSYDFFLNDESDKLHDKYSWINMPELPESITLFSDNMKLGSNSIILRTLREIINSLSSQSPNSSYFGYLY